MMWFYTGFGFEKASGRNWSKSLGPGSWLRPQGKPEQPGKV